MDTQDMEEPVIATGEEDECKQFICFLDTGRTGDEEKDRYPVGHGTNRADALAMGFRNTIGDLAGMGVYAMAQTGYAVVAQRQLEPEQFAEFCGIIDDFFAGRLKITKTVTVERVEPS